MNLCIDIDGTITEPYYWIRRANEFFRKNVTPEDVNVYEINEILGVEREKYELFYSIYGRLIHTEARIRIGARDVLGKLARKHRVHLVSARPEKMRDVTEEWLKRYQIESSTLALLGDPNKIWKARQLECDCFIEDSYANAIQLAQAGFEVLLLDCSYNKGALPSDVTRVKNWFQIFSIIRKKEEAILLADESVGA